MSQRSRKKKPGAKPEPASAAAGEPVLRRGPLPLEESPTSDGGRAVRGKPKAADESFSVRETLRGRTIFIVGGTGFLGRLMLYHFLKFVPDLKRVFVLIRPTHGRTGQERLEKEVLDSPVFSTVSGDRDLFRQLAAEKVTVVEGDASRANLSLSEEHATAIRAEADVLINTAGNVDFNPPLDLSLGANTLGVRNALDFCETMEHRRYVHISTCFVTDRTVHRDSSPEEIVSDRVLLPTGVQVLIDPQQEITAALKDVETTKAAFETPEKAEQYRARALEELEKMGRHPSDRLVEKIAGNIRTFELREELIRVGRERAARINRPNVYTYTKTLAELLTKQREGRIDFTIVRPSIVETSVAHPFPGWNEGIQGSAPIIYLAYRGHRFVPSLSKRPGERPDGILDLVPVDLVAAGTVLATCALLRGEHQEVYQASAGPIDPPMTITRCVDLTMLTLRDRIRDEERGPSRWWKLNVPVRNVTQKTFDRFSTPRAISLLGKARSKLERFTPSLPQAAVAAAETVRANLQRFENLSRLKQRIFSEYQPFINHGYPIFENRNLKNLSDRLPAEELALFPFAPHKINFSEYFRLHVDAIAKWVFPVLEKRVSAVFRTGPQNGSAPSPAWLAGEKWATLDGPERFYLMRREAGRRLKSLADRLRTARRDRQARKTAPAPDFLPGHLRVLTGTNTVDLKGLAETDLERLGAHLSFISGATITGDDVRELGTPARLQRRLTSLLESAPPERRILPVDGLNLPDWAAGPAKDMCYQLQMQFYRNVLSTEILGAENIPLNHTNVIIVANHSSHLDYGLVWYALGAYGKDMGILAARDYFFSNFWNSTFFRNFHNLIPLERESRGYEEAVRPALAFMQRGGPLLIFPEGTRSSDGRMQTFRQGLGYLVKRTGADVLPAFLRDTHRALPKGAGLWRVFGNRKVGIRFGKPIPNAELCALGDGLSSTRSYYKMTKHLEETVRSLSH